MKIINFVKKRKHLFWDTENYENLSEEVIVQAVLNYGNFDDIKAIFKILTLKRVANIFQKQIKRKRNNYDPKIKNYFNLYFKNYA